MNLEGIRKHIHKYPELSGEEKNTAEYISRILDSLKPDNIITNLGGFGIMALFKGSKPSKSIMLRCDMDAVPVNEEHTFEYASVVENVSHACGHDGHMAIMAGLAEQLANKRAKHNVYILFQPSEENGQGALNVLHDKSFPEKRFDHVFALHNLPGYPLGSLVWRENIFAYASVGVEITLTGRSSHAAFPELGISPVGALARILDELDSIKEHYRRNESYLTVISVSAGSRAFGTSPSSAVMLLTMRSKSSSMLDEMKDHINRSASQIAAKERLKMELNAFEYFPECINDKQSVQMLKTAAESEGFNSVHLEKPMRWSEDFAVFLSRYSGAIAGIGMGETCPPLHSPSYDFNDKAIRSAVKMLYKLVLSVN